VVVEAALARGGDGVSVDDVNVDVDAESSRVNDCSDGSEIVIFVSANSARVLGRRSSLVPAPVMFITV